jgi:hypothetical protein
MYIKKLTIDDFQLVEKFLPETDFIKNGLKNYYLKSEKHSIFGIFDGDQLIEFAALIESDEIPAWVLSKTFSFLKVHSQILLDHILEIEEDKKRYQFFTVGDMIDVDITERYRCYIEHVVRQGTFTGYENIDHDVLEYQTFDKDLYIYFWVLKNEYRSF